MKDDFFYAPSQRRGVIFLLLILMGYFTYLILKNYSDQNLEPIEFIKDLPNFPPILPINKIQIPITKNPNFWNKNDWKKLGLSEKQILLIENYKSSLKKFKSKEEFYRCYAFSEENKKMLDSIIKFPIVKKSNKNLFLLLKSTNKPDYNLNKTFDTVYYQKINKR